MSEKRVDPVGGTTWDGIRVAEAEAGIDLIEETGDREDPLADPIW